MVLATVAKRQIAVLGTLLNPTTVLATAVGLGATIGIRSVGVVLAVAHAVGVDASGSVFLTMTRPDLEISITVAG